MMLRLCLDRLRLFPAYAGVIPMMLNMTEADYAFPRLRGGDPYRGRKRNEHGSFSPPTRG